MEQTQSEMGTKISNLQRQLKVSDDKLQRAWEMIDELKIEREELISDNYALRQKAALDAKRFEEIRSRATDVNKCTVKLEEGVREILSSLNPSTKSQLISAAKPQTVTNLASTTNSKPMNIQAPNPTSTPKPASILKPQSMMTSNLVSSEKTKSAPTPAHILILPPQPLASTSNQTVHLKPMQKVLSATPATVGNSLPAQTNQELAMKIQRSELAIGISATQMRHKNDIGKRLN